MQQPVAFVSLRIYGVLVRWPLMEAPLVVFNLAFVQFVFRFCIGCAAFMYRCCIHVPSLYRFCNLFNIEKMKANIKHENGHSSSPKASTMARIWSKCSYHVPRCFAMLKGCQFEMNYRIVVGFWVVIKVHNPINRGRYISFEGLTIGLSGLSLKST